MKIVEKIFIFLFAFASFLGIFFLESHLSKSVELIVKTPVFVTVADQETIVVNHLGERKNIEGPRDIALAEGDIIDTLRSVSTAIHFSDRGLMRLASSSMVRLAVIDRETDGVSFQLLQGRVWGNQFFSFGPMNLLAGGAYLIPDHAIFDVSYDNAKTTIYAHRHQLVVGLVPLDYVFGPVLSTPAQDFMNSYLLTQGNSTTVFNDTVKNEADTLKKLLYSKLIKEFQYGLFDQEQFKTDLWLSRNKKADDDFSQAIHDTQLQKIREHGLSVQSLSSFAFQTQQMKQNVSDALTFAQEKLIDHNVPDIVDQIFDAEYLTLFERSTEAKERLEYLKQLIHERALKYGQDFRDVVNLRLHQEYLALAFVDPSNPLFEVKKNLSDLLIENLGTTAENLRAKFLLVRDYLNGVYDIADKNAPLARLALADYYQRFLLLVGQEKNRLGVVKSSLVEENQVMDNLFLQYPQFYRDNFFAMKSRLEQDLLAVINDENDKNEEKQTLVSMKIDFLKQLKNFFLADKITLDDARQIVFRLFREADDLQLPQDTQAAVGELFAQQLDDFGVFFRYLNSSDYVATTLHGSSREQQFREFVQAQSQKVSIEEVRQEILQGKTGTVPSTSLVSPTPSVSPGVAISPDSSGTSNSNPSVLPNPASPQNLPGGVSPIPSPTSSKSERVAKILLIQQLKAVGIATTTEDQIQVINFNDRTYTVTAAHLASDSNIQFSFSFQGKDKIVSNLVVTTAAGEKSFEGTLPLADLVTQVKNIFGQFSQS